jgi:thiamine biosynthesis lipoprotein
MLAWVGGALACTRPAPELRRSWPTMGTYATVAARGAPPEAQRAIDTTRTVFDRVAATMSNWSADSELSRLNGAAARGPYRIEDEALASCLQAALDGAARTDGAFDPTVGPLMTAWGFRPKAPRVPSEAAIAEALERVGAGRVRYDAASRTVRFERPGMEIDLGGIAKGCALDEARHAIGPRDARLSVDLDLGGQWAYLGGGTRVTAIADPAARDRILGEVEAQASDSVATSSDSENHFETEGKTYGHVMDPRTGRPSESDVIQATVLDPSATTAEVLGKALMVAGSGRAAEILRRFPRARAVLIVREGDRLVVLASASLRARLRLAPDGRFAADSLRMLPPSWPRRTP